MSSVNKVFLLGRLGNDPSFAKTETPICNFSLATSQKGKDGTEHTEWHRCSAFNSAAEVAGKYLKRGSQVFIEGSLRTRKWSKDGIDQYTTEVIVGRLTMLGKRDEDSSTSAKAYAKASGRDMTDFEDDIPF